MQNLVNSSCCKVQPSCDGIFGKGLLSNGAGRAVDRLQFSSSMFSRAGSVTLVEGTELLLSILLEVATCFISMLSSLDSPEMFPRKLLFETSLKNWHFILLSIDQEYEN